MNLYDLATEIDDVNNANGFDMPTWDNLPVKCMLVITEVEEAREGRYSNLEEELADISIRLLSILNSIWSSNWEPRIAYQIWNRDELPRLFKNIEVCLWPIISNVCKAVECWRKENNDACRMNLEMALKETIALSNSLGIRLEYRIKEKIAKNRYRGKWHGKARADG